MCQRSSLNPKHYGELLNLKLSSFKKPFVWERPTFYSIDLKFKLFAPRNNNEVVSLLSISDLSFGMVKLFSW